MSAQILQALSGGFSATQIIDYIIKKFPQHAKKISKAISEGYTPDTILEHLGTKTEFEQARSKDIQRSKNINKAALIGAGVGAAALAIPLASQAFGSALSRALPQSLRSLGQGIQSAIAPSLTNPGTQPVQQSPVQPPATPPTQSLSSQPPGQNVIQNIPQTTTIQQPKINITDVLSKNQGFVSKIDDLVKAGNTDPKAIAGYFKQFNPSETKKLEKEVGLSIDEVITEYLSANPAKDANELMRQESLGKFNEKVKKPSILDEEIERFQKGYGTEHPKIEKSSTVLSPQGIGEVKEIRNGKAIVEIEGKKHQVDEKDLETSPLPEKELADIYEDLKQKIESESGQEMSRHVTFLGYDPNMKQLIYMPWRGQPYTYNEVTDEEISDLKDKINRKTSGENFIGAYQEGTESPIGTAMSAFIQRRKASQKDVEKKEPIHKAKFEKLYYAYEPAEKEAEARYKERKKQSKKNPRIP